MVMHRMETIILIRVTFLYKHKNPKMVLRLVLAMCRRLACVVPVTNYNPILVAAHIAIGQGSSLDPRPSAGRFSIAIYLLDRGLGTRLLRQLQITNN